MKKTIGIGIMALVAAFGILAAEPHSEGVSRVPIVPEPSTYAIAGVALATIIGFQYFRRKK